MALKQTSILVLTLAVFVFHLDESQPAAPPTPPAPHSFTVQDGHFALDGKPFRIISGEMHYPRIPRAYWRDRFRMAKAMGLNTITTYVFWNVHEPTARRLRLLRQNDVAEYIREAQQEGLYVILRPGPYVCAEWEFGGFPAVAAERPRPGCAQHRSEIHGRRRRAGSRGSARNWRRCRSATAARSSRSRWKTSTDRSATTTPTWSRSGRRC